MRALILFAHPLPDSFGAALRDTAAEALQAGGHDVRIHDLYAEGFDPVLSAEAHRAHLDPPERKPEIAAEVVLLRWAEWLVFVYPTWWGGQPAILKGWLDRVLVAGVAYDLPPGAQRIRPRLQHVRRISVVTTHGSSKWVNAVQGEPGKRVLLRGLRSLCHPLTRTQWIALYGLDKASATRRTRFVQKVRRALG